MQNIDQSFETNKYHLFSYYKKKPKTNQVSFKYIATILIESYEIKILISLSSPLLNNTNSSCISVSSFVRRVILAVKPFPLLKKKKINRNISFFSRQMYFQFTLLLPGPEGATKARMTSGTTGNEKNRKYQTN